MKRVLVVLLIVVVLIVAAGFIARQYLRSGHVASQVATRLEKLYGGPVRVESVDVGLSSSTLSGFELFERESEDKGAVPPLETSESGTPWLTVGSINADVSLWDLIRGQAVPKHVTLKNPRVVLRFDPEGQLLTRLPMPAGNRTDSFDLSSVPTVDIQQGEVVLRKVGHPELVARDVNIQLTRQEGGKLLISGTTDATQLGKLVASGSLDVESGQAQVSVKTEGKAHMTNSLLNSLPYVPASTCTSHRGRHAGGVDLALGRAQRLDQLPARHGSGKHDAACGGD
jgi:hypothetical protein